MRAAPSTAAATQAPRDWPWPAAQPPPALAVADLPELYCASWLAIAGELSSITLLSPLSPARTITRLGGSARSSLGQLPLALPHTTPPWGNSTCQGASDSYTLGLQAITRSAVCTLLTCGKSRLKPNSGSSVISSAESVVYRRVICGCASISC